jgi:hypothetical protein
MIITQTLTVPADHRLAIDVPPEIPAGGQVFIAFIPAKVDLKEAYDCDNYDPNEELLGTDVGNVSDFPQIPLAELAGERIFGLARGQFWMADDFDAPLEDFKDYM